jgi:hypothetical protein
VLLPGDTYRKPITSITAVLHTYVTHLLTLPLEIADVLKECPPFCFRVEQYITSARNIKQIACSSAEKMEAKYSYKTFVSFIKLNHLRRWCPLAIILVWLCIILPSKFLGTDHIHRVASISMLPSPHFTCLIKYPLTVTSFSLDNQKSLSLHKIFKL